MNTPNIEKLLVRYYNDELPFDQTARVAAWIAASEENRKIAEQVYYICFAAETQEAKAALDTAGALRKVKGRIRAEKWRRTLRQVERAAAVMLLPLVGLSAYLLMQVGYKYNSMVEIRSTTGMVSSVTLPDDTRVWLNSNSYLRYPRQIHRARSAAWCSTGRRLLRRDQRPRTQIRGRSAIDRDRGLRHGVQRGSL